MKVGIVGLGLIGGSIFKKLSSLEEYEVIGVSRSLEGVENVSRDYESIKDCDLVFVCTPMNTVLKTLDIFYFSDIILSTNSILVELALV